MPMGAGGRPGERGGQGKATKVGETQGERGEGVGGLSRGLGERVEDVHPVS